MEKDKCWLKFIISGKAEDYLKYSNAKNTEDVIENTLHNSRSGNRAEQYRG